MLRHYQNKQMRTNGERGRIVVLCTDEWQIRMLSFDVDTLPKDIAAECTKQWGTGHLNQEGHNEWRWVLGTGGTGGTGGGTEGTGHAASGK